MPRKIVWEWKAPLLSSHNENESIIGKNEHFWRFFDVSWSLKRRRRSKFGLWRPKDVVERRLDHINPKNSKKIIWSPSISKGAAHMDTQAIFIDFPKLWWYFKQLLDFKKAPTAPNSPKLFKGAFEHGELFDMYIKLSKAPQITPTVPIYKRRPPFPKIKHNSFETKQVIFDTFKTNTQRNTFRKFRMSKDEIGNYNKLWNINMLNDMSKSWHVRTWNWKNWNLMILKCRCLKVQNSIIANSRGS